MSFARLTLWWIVSQKTRRTDPVKEVLGSLEYVHSSRVGMRLHRVRSYTGICNSYIAHGKLILHVHVAYVVADSGEMQDPVD